MKRAIVLCPGRGSYTKSQLGSLSNLDIEGCHNELSSVIDVVDVRREAAGEITLRGMDGADKFRSSFLAGANAAPLIFAVTASEMARLDQERITVVGVGGNSMGWYSALWAAGALNLEGAFHLTETMGRLTGEGAAGGQLIYPGVDDEWRVDDKRNAAVDHALAAAMDAGHRAGDSIRFGGFRVLWGDDDALEVIAGALPSCQLGKTQYPLRLLGNSAFHSELMDDASLAGQAALADLGLGAPTIPLIDGRGVQWRPLTTDPAALLHYTLESQVTQTFDFSRTVRVALREYAPDLVIALGPGESLGAAVAQVMIAEKWRGIGDREAFLARQAEDPVVVSLGRPEQASLVTKSG